MFRGLKYNQHLYRYICQQVLNDTKLVKLFIHCHLFLGPAVEFDETQPEEIHVNVPADAARISSICEALVQKTSDLCFCKAEL